MIGDGPCTCGRMIYNIPLTGHSEPASDGGTDYAIAPGVFCPDCKTELKWVHEPTSASLEWDLSTINKNVTVKNE